MSLLLAPYNNGMRLGQGFNSYTHQICVDNAVVINPERAENVISNNGTTMRILAQEAKKASIWRQMKEVVADGQVVPASRSTEPDPSAKPIPPAEDDGTHLVDSVASSKDTLRGKAQNLNAEDDAQHKADMDAAEKEAVAKKVDGSPSANTDPAASGSAIVKPEDMTAEQADVSLNKSKDDEKAKVALRKAATEEQLKADAKKAVDLPDAKKGIEEKDKLLAEKLEDRGQGINVTVDKEYAWSKEDAAKGNSQTVTHSARFVDKLSEVNREMSGSAALAITGSSFSGSGNAAFVDTEKFFASDIRFLLSVKVVNQSINFKDALEYNPIRSVSEKNKEEFTKVFGDSYISGFLEGGELTAVVMIKILNDAKKTDIKAEAQVALTVGKDLDIDGAGNVALAKKNIKMNTEISIQVRWAGGGSIKSYDEEWNIDSLMAAANRFPYLVSMFPQRTHAILTKYDTLRSFVLLKAPSISPLKYENAQLYTETLLDYYLEYTLLLKRVSADIATIQNGTKRFKEVAPVAPEGGPAPSNSLQNATQPNGQKLEKFASTLEGLDLSRKGIRAQINAIVKEVNDLTEHPERATHDQHQERDHRLARTRSSCRQPSWSLPVRHPIVRHRRRGQVEHRHQAAQPLCRQADEALLRAQFDQVRARRTEDRFRCLGQGRHYAKHQDRSGVAGELCLRLGLGFFIVTAKCQDVVLLSLIALAGSQEDP
ncbi:hypothetical protein V8E36_007762 [Tilletia maclaganii]